MFVRNGQHRLQPTKIDRVAIVGEARGFDIERGDLIGRRRASTTLQAIGARIGWLRSRLIARPS
ncbi:MAG TPA: hypothetical protein VM689_06240 [Aliidongia sp.]|nr:hypothetical protein [Aliidongia sp.]